MEEGLKGLCCGRNVRNRERARPSLSTSLETVTHESVLCRGSSNALIALPRSNNKYAKCKILRFLSPLSPSRLLVNLFMKQTSAVPNRNNGYKVTLLQTSLLCKVWRIERSGNFRHRCTSTVWDSMWKKPRKTHCNLWPMIFIYLFIAKKKYLIQWENRPE